jgi:hypothetical protein
MFPVDLIESYAPVWMKKRLIMLTGTMMAWVTGLEADTKLLGRMWRKPPVAII